MQSQGPSGAEALDRAVHKCLSGRAPQAPPPPRMQHQETHPYIAARQNIRVHLEAVLAAVPARALMSPETSAQLLQHLAAAPVSLEGGPGAAASQSALAIFTLRHLAALSCGTHPALFAQVGQGGPQFRGAVYLYVQVVTTLRSQHAHGPGAPTISLEPTMLPPARLICRRRRQSLQQPQPQ